VTVVGWLESDQSKLASQVGHSLSLSSSGVKFPKVKAETQIDTGTAYTRPLPLGMEAIYIANSRPPPNGAVYRGTITPPS
jgi:hypothetical protein